MKSLRQQWEQGPFSLTVFPSQFKFDGKSFHYHIDSKTVIAWDLMTSSGFIARKSFCRIWICGQKIVSELRLQLWIKRWVDFCWGIYHPMQSRWISTLNTHTHCAIIIFINNQWGFRAGYWLNCWPFLKNAHPVWCEVHFFFTILCLNKAITSIS